MSIFPIFKVNKLTNKEETEKIFVFSGINLDLDKDPNELFERDPTNKAFTQVFNQTELDNIKTNNIQVEFLKQTIHIDDSIGIIKLKVFEAMRKAVSMSEIYLFCLKEEKINPITMYQNLTQNDHLPLTRIRLEQMLKNIYDEDGEPIDFGLPMKEKYTFDDILKLDLTERTYSVAKVLGQKFVFGNEYPFIANPFYVTEYDTLLENSRKELTSLNNSLLLETFPIFNNTIYLCVAADVFSKEKRVSIEYTCKIYFPFLYQDNIDTIDKLDETRDKLIADTSNKLTPDVEKSFESIDMFYNVFQSQLPSKKFSEKTANAGIKFIKIIMHPDFQIKIPIDVIFKLIHATKEFPLIKFNPETRQENIYRLYTEQITADGRKIPFLNKAIIFKLIKNIGKGKSVAAYTNIIFKGTPYYMVCEFADNGSITVHPMTDFETPVSFDKDEIDTILSLAVNPLIEQIKPFFEQSGLEIPLFASIKSANVEIRELTYQTVYAISNPIDISQYIGCISSAFTVESNNFKKGIEMRFKRVANFNKRDSQEAFIIEKIDQGLKFDEIVEELIQNYTDVNDEIAADLIAKIRAELEVTRGANRRRSLMIKINPGFKTSISLNSIVSEITVTVEGINDIFYLNTIPVYIDALIRISQDRNSSKIRKEDITKLCSGKELQDVEFGQITAVSEQTLSDNQVPEIEDEIPVYSDKKASSSEVKMGENMDDLLDLLAFDDDDEEEAVINRGGQGSSSGEDIPTPSLSSSSGEDVPTPSLSSSASKSKSSGSAELMDVSIPSPSSSTASASDPNKDEFQEKSVVIPSSKNEESDQSESAEVVDVKTPSLSSSASASKSVEDTASKESDQSKSAELADVPTPSLSSSKSKESDQSKSAELADVATPSLSSSKSKESDQSGEDVATPSLSSSKSKESDQSESAELADVATPSLSSSTTTDVSEKEEEVIQEEKPNPVVEVEVNINKPATPPKEEIKPLVIEEEVIKPKSVTPVPLEVEEVEEEVVKPKSVTPVPLEVEEVEEIEEVVVKPKKGKAKKEKKIEEIGKELENTVRDITNMKLKYPNPFSARLESRASQLFVREKNDKIDVYTRMCPFSLNDRRQPVILNKKEKDELLEDHPDLNQESDFIEYSTDPTDSSKKFYYTCPRFWCMLTDKMVTEQDILDGKCGPKVKKVEDAIIPKTADTIKNDGRYVYQFYDDSEKKFPGFHKKKTDGSIVKPNSNGAKSALCIPCCYNKWSTEEMKNRRNICQGTFEESASQSVSDEEKDFEEQLKRDVLNAENYVKGPEKYGPQLGEHRWGFLPVAVQKFLHEVNEECQVSAMNASLKPNHTCILRHGVEIHSQQSFIACIASAMFYGQLDENTRQPLITKFIPNAKYEVPSIDEMKNKIIIPAINIDKFVKYQNGDLVTSFANPAAEVDINKAEYTKSKLYKKSVASIKSKEGSPDQSDANDRDENTGNKPMEFFTRVVQAYENFILFLKDPKINIDYTYLWDLVCMPNSGLFDNGINLIILEIPDDDITNNIELVCPTNRYSTHIYDVRKRSLILIKRENYFEPIYGYRNNLDRNIIQITKTFSEYDRQLPKTLRAVFTKIIKPTLGERCRTFPSNTEYKFKHPPLLDNLIVSLIDKKYIVLSQVLNFQGKVIGLLTKSSTLKEGFVPCYPSSLTVLKNSKNKKKCDLDTACDYDFVYMSDQIWKPYDETFAFLKEYYDYKEGSEGSESSNCFADNSFCRVVKDELIIGFLTNTNQFVRILDPIPVSSVDDNIKTFTNNDMLVADIETLTSTKVDTKRTDYIKRIQLETNFYNVFRNTIRILFNDYSNSEKRKAIQDECNKRYIVYRQQIDTVVEMLHELVDTSIIFSTGEDGKGYNYKNINENEIHNCIKLSKEKCLSEDSNSSSICQITDDKCTLILPKKNLITDTDNELFYYGRMADELIRYNRIKSFIFKPQAYLSFGQIKYNLRDNEILILQDLLTQEFFENLIPADINKYAKYNTYDTAEPIMSQAYKKDIELDEAINPNHERDCFRSEPSSIKSIVWRSCFPSNCNEVTYTGSHFCALYLIIDLIKEFNGQDLTMEEIKDVLIDEYRLLTDNYKNKSKINTIINILREEGQFDANQLQDETINFEQLILQEGFGAVNFDMWILLVKYEIPSIFISSKEIPETRFNHKEFVCYMDEKHGDHFAFIVTPAMYRRSKLKNPEYKLIIDDRQRSNISLKSLKEGSCLQQLEEAINIAYPINKYIEEIFEKDNTTKYKKRQKNVRDIEFVEVSQTPMFQEPAKKLDEALEDQDQDENEEFEIEVKPKKIVKLKRNRKLKPTIILEEEAEEVKDINDIKDIKEGDKSTSEFEIELPLSNEKAQKKKAKKKTKVKFNPPGKTKTRKNLSV